MRTVLTIAGFDPSSGAGVTADLMVFAAHGLFGTSCITSSDGTVNDGGASGASDTAGDGAGDARLPAGRPSSAGIKIGMLATEETVAAVADFLGELRSRRQQRIPVVLDPVLRSSFRKGTA